uniref:Uncharacterized protein n=1 Tax=Glossina austeni TaxID=7395 RepID=A0A1A9UPT8_GLOAU
MVSSYEDKSKNTQHGGQSVALLETPNGVTIIERNGTEVTSAMSGQNRQSNDVQIRNHSQTGNDEDDSFEYGTDRESSVYNPTTQPLRNVMAAAGGRNSQRSNNNDSDSSELLTKGNQLGIPESRFSRWIPKDQREILEKQAKLLANRLKPKTNGAQSSERKPSKTPPPTPAARTTEPSYKHEPTETEI